VTTGNAIQLTGIVLGAAVIYLDGRLDAAEIVRIVLMILAFLAIYICCHSLGHYLIGRLVGIHFRGYGLRGTDHPEAYPPGVRQAMSAMPFFTVMTEKSSMAKAKPVARAVMFAAGETSSIVCSLAAGWFAGYERIPGGGILLIVAIVASLFAIVSAFFPKGDYAKALGALRVTP